MFADRCGHSEKMSAFKLGNRSAISEQNLLDGGETMLLAKVPIHTHRECSSVFVAEAAAESGNVHAGFNARRGEEVTEIVMDETGRPEIPTNGGEALLDVVNNAERI